MLVFEGKDADDWIYRVERYFTVNGLTEEERLIAPDLYLEGMALLWYKWIDRRELIRNWREFKGAFLERFRPSRAGDLLKF